MGNKKFEIESLNSLSHQKVPSELLSKISYKFIYFL